MLEYPFLTLLKYPVGFIVHFGATVSARSVKLLEKAAEKDEIETRDSWFNELRMEIRGHAKSLGVGFFLKCMFRNKMNVSLFPSATSFSDTLNQLR